MLTAREMFESMGFTQIKFDDKLVYKMVDKETGLDWKITFEYNYKRYWNTIKEKGYNTEPIFTSRDVHEAIHRQCYELGWIHDPVYDLMDNPVRDYDIEQNNKQLRSDLVRCTKALDEACRLLASSGVVSIYNAYDAVESDFKDSIKSALLKDTVGAGEVEIIRHQAYKEENAYETN